MSAHATAQSSQMRLHLRGELLEPLPQGALWWSDQRILIVSDLHLEKGSSYAARGQMLPPYDTSATLGLVEQLVADFAPDCVISLGDSFHDGKAERRMDEADTERVRSLTRRTDWIWVEGNHDPDPPAHLGGRAAKALRIADLVFRHEPTGESGEIAGHLHPCARVISRVRSLRRRCFVTDGERLIMPAMGVFTGGLNVLDTAYEPCFPEGGMMVFAMTQDAVIPISTKRLVPDGARSDLGKWRL
ncbi:ligase-associated DNA damage response endonuclease PdeM [Hyphomonas sp. FCG-A18]|uniref:ligase-associated DNA damage response endonuclease PdeM n=1 Tax=Hyphomonas sp. FCG-A18 TaxID=3080019 RepID=UPI002B296E25|nr:ligase-associated DNA damage response endonuclease PdeM [Hyphomonas sp. FCG-A18]